MYGSIEIKTAEEQYTIVFSCETNLAGRLVVQNIGAVVLMHGMIKLKTIQNRKVQKFAIWKEPSLEADIATYWG